LSVRSRRDRFVKLSLNSCRDFVESANRLQFDASFAQVFSIIPQKLLQKSHQRINLFFRAPPVFSRKGIESQVLDTELETGFHAFFGRIGSLEVTPGARPTTLPGPTAVAVHDHCDMFQSSGGHASNPVSCVGHYTRIVWARLWPTPTSFSLAPVKSQIRR